MLEFDDDKLKELTQIDKDVYQCKEIMTKEMFVECFKRWILPDIGIMRLLSRTLNTTILTKKEKSNHGQTKRFW